jgi:hypothetical protein
VKPRFGNANAAARRSVAALAGARLAGLGFGFGLAAAVACSLACEREARADAMTRTATEADDPTFRPVDRERRAGVVLGASVGVGFASASGYPNNVNLEGNPDFYSKTPILVGVSHSYFVMGAFSDYVSLGPMLSIATFDTPEWRSVGFGVGFRVELFPLVRVAPTFADTAVFSQLGVGSTEARAKGPYPSADGAQSFLGIGLHHEFRLTRLLGGHAVAGPFVEYDAITSTTAERHWLTLGLRVAWNAGTVGADRR